MRTTLNIDDQLMQEAMKLSGITEKTALVKAGLEALVRAHASKRLAALGGTEPDLPSPPPRRRIEDHDTR